MTENTTANTPQSSATSELAVRREKLAALAAAGCDPFTVTRFDVTADSAEIKAHQSEYAGDAATGKEGKTVSVAGRIVSRRVMGKASFVHLLDRSGKIQLYVRREDVGEEV